MELQELKIKLDSDLKTQYISSLVLLDNLRVINEDSRKSSSYVDPIYIPFYYYLGKYLKPESLIEVGLGLAFCSTSFLRSAKTVKNFLAFQEKTEEYYSYKFALNNIKSIYRDKFEFHYGKLEEYQKTIKTDLVIFNEEKSYDKQLFDMDYLWNYLNLDGYFIVDHVNSDENTNKAFENFCKIKNRESIILKTRYGTGIVKK